MVGWVGSEKKGKKMLKCELKTIERVSKKGTTYNFSVIKLSCPKCGAFVEIEDYSSPLPVGVVVKDLDVTIETKKVNNLEFLVIKDLDYSISFKYKLAVNLLNKHQCVSSLQF